MSSVESTGLGGRILTNRRERAEQLRSILFGAPRYPNLDEYDPIRIKKWVTYEGRPWPGNNLAEASYPYVVSPRGEIILPQRSFREQLTYHPQLTEGDDVIGAGVLRIRRGEVCYLDNDSGHYEPDLSSVTITLLVMRLWGVPLVNDLIRGARRY